MREQSRKKTVRLSQRLKQLAEMVSQGNSVADVGCDHGFLSIYLIQQGISPRVIAMDVRKGPLAGADAHVAAYGLGEYIEIRLSDGLGAIRPAEADTLVLAGMGGRLMQRILSAEPEKTRSFKELILQPQSEIAEFRSFLRREGYVVLQESILYEEGQYYFPIKAEYRPEADSGREVSSRQQELFDAYGELLIRRKDKMLIRYLEERRDKLTELKKQLEETDRKKTEAKTGDEIKKEEREETGAGKRDRMKNGLDRIEGELAGIEYVLSLLKEEKQISAEKEAGCIQ